MKFCSSIFKYIRTKHGSQFWYKDDRLHRFNRPAIMHPYLLEYEEFWYEDGKPGQMRH